MSNFTNSIKKIYKLFCPPIRNNWGYPIFASTIAMAICFAFRVIINKTGWGWPATSLAGYALLIPIVSLITYIVPTAALSNKYSDSIVGKYTGIGALILSFISGIPLMLITRGLRNLVIMSWTSLRLNMVYPVYFYKTDLNSLPISLFEGLVDTVIPGIAAILFFCGILWSSFRSGTTTSRYVITGLAMAALSLDAYSALSIFVAGAWLSALRSKVQNIWGPFACIIGTRLSQVLLNGIVKEIDITNIQTYSDVDATFLYSSVPSVLFGTVLIFFLLKMLNSFYQTYESKPLGFEDTLDVNDDVKVSPLEKGFNLPFLTATIIWVIVWTLVIKGVHI